MRLLAVMLALLLICPLVAQDLSAALSEADALWRARQYDAAEAQFSRALELAGSDEEHAQTRWMLASARQGRGDISGALEALEPVLELAGGPWVMRALETLASLAERERQPELAARAWQRISEVAPEGDPRRAEARLAVARQALLSGDAKGAADGLRELLAEEPPEHVARQARDMLTGVLTQLGRFEEALAVARDAEDDGRRVRLLMSVAQALSDAGHAGLAVDVSEEILALEPGHLQAMRLIYRIAVQEGTADALREELTRRAQSENPEGALRFLAEIAVWQNEPEAAVEALGRLAGLLPRDVSVRIELGRQALEAGELAAAEDALRKALELSPGNRVAAMTLAEVLIRTGRSDEAVDLLREAAEYTPTDPNAVRSLGQMLAANSLHHQALETYLEGREAADDPTLFAFEIAREYAALLQHREAAKELLAALQDDRVPARMVGYELQHLVRDEMLGDDVMDVLDGAMDQIEPGPEGRLALAQVYLQAGRAEQAAELVAGLRGAGEELISFARDSDLRGQREMAAALYEMALEADLSPPARTDAVTRLARILAEEGRWREALAVLDDPAVEDSPRALLLRGRLLLERARDLDAARETFERLMATGHPDYMEAAQWAMADWLFASGRLEEAEAAYAELAGDAAQQPVEPLQMPPLPPGFELMPNFPEIPRSGAEEQPDVGRAELRLAEIALRRGEIEEARERFRLVAAAHPDSPHANDALERLAFIRENLDGQGVAEEHYLKALGMLDRGALPMAEQVLAEVAATRGEPLADDAQMLLANVRAEQGEHEAAVRAWERLTERFPESLLAPEALLRGARLQRDELGDVQAAARMLRAVIEGYPDSAAAAEARSELELLPRSASRLDIGLAPEEAGDT